jgi:hypothetical protein
LTRLDVDTTSHPDGSLDDGIFHYMVSSFRRDKPDIAHLHLPSTEAPDYDGDLSASVDSDDDSSADEWQGPMEGMQ